MKRLFLHLLPLGLAVASATAFAAAEGYSVNSDAADGDSLHRIDLVTGQADPVSELQVLSGIGVRKDVEGLAFDSDNTLWAVDEESMRLFPVSLVSGAVMDDGDMTIDGLSSLQANDFGMTFTCSNELYVSSVAAQTLYRLQPDDDTAKAVAVGGEGALGYRISALAARGSNPTELYGLGNGLVNDGNTVTEDSRSLFRIDPDTGKATPIGKLGRPAADDYFEAGLSFDSDGTLWAVIDRGDKPNQVLQIDPQTGAATLVSTVSGSGFESLAVAPPANCDQSGAGAGDYAAIPTLDRLGLMLTLLVLLGTGLLTLHRRTRASA